MLASLLLSVSAWAIDPHWRGEWKETHRARWLYITDQYFIFRECGRYSVIGSSSNRVRLFRGIETKCLRRGEHQCSITPKSNSEMILNCGEWERTYIREK